MYFAIIYIALAIDVLVAFVAFPVLCVFHSPKRDLLGNWIMSVLSDIITPLLDAISTDGAASYQYDAGRRDSGDCGDPDDHVYADHPGKESH